MRLLRYAFNANVSACIFATKYDVQIGKARGEVLFRLTSFFFYFSVKGPAWSRKSCTYRAQLQPPSNPQNVPETGYSTGFLLFCRVILVTMVQNL